MILFKALLILSIVLRGSFRSHVTHFSESNLKVLLESKLGMFWNISFGLTSITIKMTVSLLLQNVVGQHSRKLTRIMLLQTLVLGLAIDFCFERKW